MTSRTSWLLIKTFISTGFTLIAFAANSVLCRWALGEKTIDASGFTIIRLLSGALVLLVIIVIKSNKSSASSKDSWLAGFMLFLYAVTFSFAYITLDTGTGAIILFGAIQITMILGHLMLGNRLHISEWIGVCISFIGFTYLVLPGATSPSVTGFSLMTIAGIAWGVYTLKGRHSLNPLKDTAYNFFRTIPFIAVLLIATFQNIHFSAKGVLLAAVSGVVASGIGYTIWYIALGGLSTIQAAVVQLLVPVIAALGGIIFLSEKITFRLALSSIMILGGILMVILGKYSYGHRK